MIDKKQLFWLTLAFLQTACTENITKTTVIEKPQPPVSRKSAHTEGWVYKNEAVTVEEVPIVKPVVPVVEPPKTEIKPKPAPASAAAVQSLIADAQKKTLANDLGSADATLERALRISPRNAELTYQLAALRLKQAQPKLAEDLGKKAAFLAADNKALKKRCWLLVSEARMMLKDVQGAKEAQLKANSLK